MRIEIDRLEIVLDGVSAAVAEAAAAGLEAELRRRLGALSLVAASGTDLAIGPLAVPAGVDAATLRALIAERLLGALARPRQAQPDAQAGSA